ncbi:polyphosphate kinase [Halomonas denitrificans]|uniref:polyphosphate kinase n=1 Tax=Halomonas denitrificans TaxID=370769 RepID=UPI001C99411B|nr:polyphosphate kinase [Halomonas denitrificans]MBY5968444.1 polyphosphate kinase [Halomonas denitrificans]
MGKSAQGTTEKGASGDGMQSASGASVKRKRAKPDKRQGSNKMSAEERLRFGLLSAQLTLAQQADRAVLVLVAGHAATGKGELINQLNHWLENRLTEVHALAPGDEERCRPYWWRFWHRLPTRGRLGVFVHGWVGDAVLARASRALGEGAYSDRIEQMRQFEAELAADGVQLVKLWLQIDAESQRRRLEMLAADPATRWQVTEDKWRRHAQHGLLDELARDLRKRTHRRHSPWIELDASSGDSLLPQVATLLENVMTTPPPALEAESSPALEAVQPPSLAALVQREAPERLKKRDYVERLSESQARLAELARSAARQRVPLVVMFEGHDAAGKGGGIHRLTSALDARLYQVHQIAAPTQEELLHPWQWRFWQRLPRDGRVAVFDRSWYGRVLVERVEGLAVEDDWRRGYEEIRQFEARLLEHGAVVVKLFLAIDKDEQLARFEARAATPHKRHKLTDEDWRNRERWDDYQQAIDEMFSQTHVPGAEWTLIDANDKRRARLEVIQEVSRRLAARLPLA